MCPCPAISRQSARSPIGSSRSQKRIEKPGADAVSSIDRAGGRDTRTMHAAPAPVPASCDLAVASDAAKFCTPGVQIGLFCSTPMVALSRNVAPKHAMEMLLTGDMIAADEACRIGLVNRVVASDRLTDETTALAGRLA